MRKCVFALPVAMMLVVSATAAAQIAPCGRAVVVVTAADQPTEERFIPAPPEHVKACAVRAFPALGNKLDTDQGSVLKSKFDRFSLYEIWKETNKNAGVKGLNAGTFTGSYVVELRPETRDGIAGTHLKIEFDKFGFGASKNGATQLMEEISCLAGLLSPVDPHANPRGAGEAAMPEGREVTLPEGTPLRLVLRDPLYSKEAARNDKDWEVVFEVADDVIVDGTTLIRKGALGVGHLVDTKAAGRAGKGGRISFAIDKVTAVDGQSVPITGLAPKRAGANLPGVIPSDPSVRPGTPVPVAMGANLASAGIGLGVYALFKGQEALIRAGMTYEMETRGAATIRVAR